MLGKKVLTVFWLADIHSLLLWMACSAKLKIKYTHMYSEWYRGNIRGSIVE